MAQVEKAKVRLFEFIRQQKRHWSRLKKGIIPEDNIITGWIESCDFANEDLQALAELSGTKDEGREMRDDKTEGIKFTKKVELFLELSLAAIKGYIEIPKPKLHEIIDDILKYITEACDIIDRLQAENKYLKEEVDSGCHIHTLETPVDKDGCCVACGEDLNLIAGQAGQIEKLQSEIDRLDAQNKRQSELLHRHRICISCGKQLSEAEATSIHTCFDEQALKGITND